MGTAVVESRPRPPREDRGPKELPSFSRDTCVVSPNFSDRFSHRMGSERAPVPVPAPERCQHTFFSFSHFACSSLCLVLFFFLPPPPPFSDHCLIASLASGVKTTGFVSPISFVPLLLPFLKCIHLEQCCTRICPQN
jgi:hypothetical protein